MGPRAPCERPAWPFTGPASPCGTGVLLGLTLGGGVAGWGGQQGRRVAGGQCPDRVWQILDSQVEGTPQALLILSLLCWKAQPSGSDASAWMGTYRSSS